MCATWFLLQLNEPGRLAIATMAVKYIYPATVAINNLKTPQGDAPTKRRRRRPEEARREILDAAEALLAERPGADITVQAIMDHQEPTAEPLLDRVQIVADSKIGNLDKQIVIIGKQRVMKTAALLKIPA